EAGEAQRILEGYTLRSIGLSFYRVPQFRPAPTEEDQQWAAAIFVATNVVPELIATFAPILVPRPYLTVTRASPGPRARNVAAENEAAGASQAIEVKIVQESQNRIGTTQEPQPIPAKVGPAEGAGGNIPQESARVAQIADEVADEFNTLQKLLEIQ